ncbi:MAG: hypothetical protein C4K58_05465 [Flavobacteriaceae bacterium]|nr:MAG: hypothetical protein C4K58_05465 [Flavobacteriaceae bacterium]
MRNFLRLFLIVVFSVSLRLFFELSGQDVFFLNLTPIGAIAFLTGSQKGKLSYFALPLGVLLTSDFLLANLKQMPYWDAQSVWTYLAFSVIFLFGIMLKNKKYPSKILFGSLGSVFIHWIITDFGVWVSTLMYPKTALGFVECLVAAIPFEMAFLFGTVFHVSLYLGLQFAFLKFRKTQTVTL